MSTALGNRQENRSSICSTFGNLSHVNRTFLTENMYDILVLLLLLGQSIIEASYVETQYQQSKIP
jgi:hypothetical protein